MYSRPTLRRALPLLRTSTNRHQRSSFAFRADSPYAIQRKHRLYRSLGLVTFIGVATSVYQWSHAGNSIIPDIHAEGPPSSTQQPPQAAEPAEIVVEESKYRQGASKDETRDHISSQHLQVRKSWENPGVWCWGSNTGKVAAPDADQTLIKNPRWLAWFDGVLLRDLKLTSNFGAAILENGDLVQWGTDYNPDEKHPVVTLKGKNLKNIALSRDRIIAVSKSGKVYSLSVSQEEQLLGPKPTEGSWIPGWPSRSAVSYRNLTPSDLSWNEKVSSLAGGLEHCLLLTSKGRVFSAASGSAMYPTRGQLGIPGLTWFTRPAGPYDRPHEIPELKDFKITQVAAGDYHSLALDASGRVFAWGDNQKGQLGIGETYRDAPFFDHPVLLPFKKLYAGTNQSPAVTSISAGGNTTFFTVDATKHAPADSDSHAAATRDLGRLTADTWAAGHGIWGQLGNGRWTHVQPLPTKIAPLSGLFEYDESRNRAVPIRMRAISVGASHCAAVMDNVTYTAADHSTSQNDTNWGADVVFFGNNEFYQLGTGKRNNLTNPTYIQPLDRRAEVVEGKRSKQEEHRFHVTPRATVRVGERWVSFEQRVVCGRGVTAVYSGV